MTTLESPSNSHMSETLKLLKTNNVQVNGTDIKEFNARVKTFILDQKWVGKPYALSPPFCARYGWKCCGANKLQCVSCSATLCTSLPEMGKCAGYDKYISKVLNSLKSAHKKHCPWPLAPCPDNFFQMVPVSDDMAFQDFVSRLETLLPIESFLPKIKDTVIEALTLSDFHFKALCEWSLIPDNPLARSAILLAATGWKRLPFDGKKYIVCPSCQRVVGVWFYPPVLHSEEIVPKKELSASEPESSVHDSSQLRNSTSGDESNNKNISAASSDVLNSDEFVVCKQECVDPSESLDNLDGENVSFDDNSFVSEDQTPTKRRKLCMGTDELFDPIYEHRPWCMWINKAGTTEDVLSNGSNTQSPSHNNRGVPGYQVYVKCLLKNIPDPRESPLPVENPMKEQLSKARELISSWTATV